MVFSLFSQGAFKPQGKWLKIYPNSIKTGHCLYQDIALLLRQRFKIYKLVTIVSDGSRIFSREDFQKKMEKFVYFF